jgi:hypothetical protein
MNFGIAAMYWYECGHAHRVTGSAANARTTDSIAEASSSAAMVLTSKLSSSSRR